MFVLNKADVAAQVFNSSADRRGNMSTLLNTIDPDVTLVFIDLLCSCHNIRLSRIDFAFTII